MSVAEKKLAAFVKDTINGFKFHGEHKVLTTVDFITGNTMDPRPRYSHLPFSFEGHEWQKDMLLDLSREQCTQKCSQIGLSELYIRKSLALCCLFGLNVGYVMPTFQGIRSYVPARFDPVIAASEKLSNMIGTPNNNEHKKFTNGANIYVRHSNSEAARISVALDAIFLDEYDRCDPDNYDAWPQRLGHSEYKIYECFSTPTYDEVGINALYRRSDSKRYMIRCTGCNLWQTMEFPDSIFFKKGLSGLPSFDIDMTQRTGVDKFDWRQKYMDRIPYVGCKKCNKELDRVDSGLREWVPEYPTRQISGRSLNRFDVPKDPITGAGHDAESIIDVFFRVNHLREFYNQVLGLPFSTSSDSLSVEDLMFATSPPEDGFLTFPEKILGPCFMGIDQGKNLHMTIYRLTGKKFDLVHAEEMAMVAGESAEFKLMSVVDHIVKMQKKFNIRAIVCDAAPDINLPRAIASRIPSRCSVSWAYFVRRTSDGFTEPTETKRSISINRTWMLSSVADMIKKDHSKYELRFPTNLFSESIGVDMSEHFRALVKSDIAKEDKDTKSPKVETVWIKRSGRADHFFMSTGYAYVAMEIYRMMYLNDVVPFMSNSYLVVHAKGFV